MRMRVQVQERVEGQQQRGCKRVLLILAGADRPVVRVLQLLIDDWSNKRLAPEAMTHPLVSASVDSPFLV